MMVEVQPLAGFNQLLTYRVSKEMTDRVKIGCLVRIPLGRRKSLGVVFNTPNNTDIPKAKLKYIEGLVQPEPVLSWDLVRLSSWIANYYSCSMESVLEAMIPGVVREGKNAKREKLIAADLAISKVQVDQELRRAPKQKELFLKLHALGKAVKKSELVGQMGFMML